ncbi:MAG: hypothetical protein AB1489_15610 [Acidobacteriota bacterium]
MKKEIIRNLILAIALLFNCAFLAMAGYDSPITTKNWSPHPTIITIRRIYQAVEQDIRKGKLKKAEREVESCSPLGDKRTIFFDSQGRIRKYVWDGGSEDSALMMRYYYDQLGRLRFIFITGGAVNGSQLEHRIYFDENRSRIWEEHKYTKGPGYTFPSIWPDSEIVYQPKQAYEDNCTAVESK